MLFETEVPSRVVSSSIVVTSTLSCDRRHVDVVAFVALVAPVVAFVALVAPVVALAATVTAVALELTLALLAAVAAVVAVKLPVESHNQDMTCTCWHARVRTERSANATCAGNRGGATVWVLASQPRNRMIDNLPSI